MKAVVDGLVVAEFAGEKQEPALRGWLLQVQISGWAGTLVTLAAAEDELPAELATEDIRLGDLIPEPLVSEERAQHVVDLDAGADVAAP